MLGVGNRRGVVVQLVGCIVAVIGMIYAFYVKPIIKRRRRQAVQATLAGRVTTPSAPATQGADLVSVGMEDQS